MHSNKSFLSTVQQVLFFTVPEFAFVQLSTEIQRRTISNPVITNIKAPIKSLSEISINYRIKSELLDT